MIKTPIASLLTLLAIGVTLSLPTGLFVLLDNLTAITDTLPTHADITVFVKDHASKDELLQLQQLINAMNNISASHFVPKQQALATLSLQMGVSELASELPENPLPDAWIVRPVSTDTTALQGLVKQLQALPAAASVQADQLWAQRLNALLDLGRELGILLVIVLAAALVSISGNTIRLQILTRQAEIEVSRLIGATNSFIHRPFLYFGVLQGLTGGLLAWALVSFCEIALAPQVSRIAALYGSRFSLHNLSLEYGLFLLGAACALGWLGAYLAVARTLAHLEKKL